MMAFKVAHKIGSIEHVFIVIAPDRVEAKRRVAQMNGGWVLESKEYPTDHPWNLSSGSWSVRMLDEDETPIRLYALDTKTGDMIA